MKKVLKTISIFSLLLVLFACTFACKQPVKTKVPTEETPVITTPVVTPIETEEPTPVESPTLEEIDYVSQLKLDMNSDTVKCNATVKCFIDGDTTHFYVGNDVSDTGVLKARYLAINTPESTGVIEEWGKAASDFTKSKLSTATSIIIESDDDKWNVDSTGSRITCWIWYKTSKDSDYRNLNLEILQNGLAIASNTKNNRYGDTCMAALNQAKALKLHIYSGLQDPGFYYGGQLEVSLKELRINIKDYLGKTVAFEALVTKNYSNALYVEDYDEETGINYGMYIYYGYNLSGAGLNIISTGNRCRIVGSVQYYEAGDSYQIADLNYSIMRPNDPKNLQLISTGNEIPYTLITAEEFVKGKVKVEYVEDVEGVETKITKEFNFNQLALDTSVSMNNLKVKSIYTTTNEDSSSKGAMTLTCECDGYTISIRTVVLFDSEGKMITDAAYLNKTINVKGVVDVFDGQYQIKVFSADNITIVEEN